MGRIFEAFLDDVGDQLLKHVPARDRSRYVSEAISAKLRQRKTGLIRACRTANGDPDALAIEREWDALTDVIAEP